MEIVNAFELVGSYRGAAALCGTTAKTVKRVLERRAAGQVGRRPAPAHGERGGADRASGSRQRCTHLRQAPVAGGQKGWLSGLCSQFLTRRGGCQSELATTASN